MTFPGLRLAGYYLPAVTFAAVVVFGVAAVSPVYGQAKPKGSAVEQVLMKLENDWNDASVKRDVTLLGRLLADDYIFTDPDGVMWTKAQAQEMLKSGEDVVTSAVATDMKVRVYGNAAIVTGHNTVKEQLTQMPRTSGHLCVLHRAYFPHLRNKLTCRHFVDDG